MDKYYLYKTDRPIDEKMMTRLIDSFYQERFTLFSINQFEGYVIANQNFALQVQEAMMTISSDLGLKLVIVCAHANNDVSRHTLSFAFENTAGFNYLSDMILEQMLSSDTKLKTMILNEFNPVSHELILTASAYLKAGLNAKAASEMLYIHRNTFNYRLDKFIELTNLDIRDYWNAFYFNLYLRISKK